MVKCSINHSLLKARCRFGYTEASGHFDELNLTLAKVIRYEKVAEKVRFVLMKCWSSQYEKQAIVIRRLIRVGV